MSMGTASLLGSRQAVADLTLTATLEVPDEFNVSSLGSVALTAGGTNENITLTSSGTGYVDVVAPSATVGYSQKWTRNTSNLSLYHGVSAAGLVTDSAHALALAANASVNLDQITLASAGSVAVVARGTNQDISLTPSGSGKVSVVGPQTVSGVVIHTLSATPSSAAAAGVVGTVSWDASYIYICTATNTWKRAAIATW